MWRETQQRHRAVLGAHCMALGLFLNPGPSFQDEEKNMSFETGLRTELAPDLLYPLPKKEPVSLFKIAIACIYDQMNETQIKDLSTGLVDIDLPKEMVSEVLSLKKLFHGREKNDNYFYFVPRVE